VKRLVNTLFDGSPELLLTHLVREQRLSDTELKRLRKLLNDRLKGGPR
jgi:predicted transcriptional regulator